MPQPPAPWGQQPPAWGQAIPVPAPPAERPGSPWLVAGTVGLAALVLALVVLGLRAAAGPGPSDEAIEVPAAPPTSGASSTPSSVRPSTPTSSPRTSPSTTTGGNPIAPGGGTPGTTTQPPTVDTTALRVKVTDQDGRFELTVPRTWLNLPTTDPEQNQWLPFTQRPTGELDASGYSFLVHWAASSGCSLDTCAAQVLERVKNTFNATPTTARDKVGELDAVRIESSAGADRIVAWVVVKGDRLWVPQLVGPASGYDAVLTVVRDVLGTMTFN